MEDFNADNAKIDQALEALRLADLRVKTGSFEGTGTTGTRTYTLGVKPKMLVVRTSYINGSYVHDKGVLANGSFCIAFNSGGEAYLRENGNPCTLTEDGFTLQLNSTVSKGLNVSGSTLHYWVIY